MAKVIFIFLGCLCFGTITKAQTDSTTNLRTDTVSYNEATKKIDSISETIKSSLDSATYKRNGKIYKLKPGADIPVIAIGTGWTLYAFSKIYSRDPSSIEKINSLNVHNIPRFDRWAADIYSEKAAEASDAFFMVLCLCPCF